jgi:saccharopine dehydrogenase-like NADP-dependent oxidoreductase
MNISVIGNGLVGSVIAKDLSRLHNVKCFDINIENQYEGILYTKFDITKDNLDILSDSDIIVLSVPGSIGFESLKRLISLGKNIVDISFFPERASNLNALALKNNVSVVVDCGVAPGLCNMFLAYENAVANESQNNRVLEYKCYVGGLPYERKLPWQYKAPFSPTDVLEEYTRTVYFRENGIDKETAPMSGIENVEIDSIGTLEAFFTDGLRSLMDSFPDIPNLAEKTLRYPGYIDKILFLKQAGFLSAEKISINNQLISPFEITSKLLIDEWKLKDEMEFTAMKVEITTEKYKKTYNLLDSRDIETGFSSMARTTGFTANAAVSLFNSGKITQKGIIFPEDITISKGNLDDIMTYLSERDIIIEEEIENR